MRPKNCNLNKKTANHKIYARLPEFQKNSGIGKFQKKIIPEKFLNPKNSRIKLRTFKQRKNSRKIF